MLARQNKCKNISQLPQHLPHFSVLDDFTTSITMKWLHLDLQLWSPAVQGGDPHSPESWCARSQWQEREHRVLSLDTLLTPGGGLMPQYTCEELLRTFLHSFTVNVWIILPALPVSSTDMEQNFKTL